MSRPVCECHGVSMWRINGKGLLGCAVREAARNSRRVRMSAGGIQFLVGRAPTPELAQQTRTKIREEAPRGAVRNS